MTERSSIRLLLQCAAMTAALGFAAGRSASAQASGAPRDTTSARQTPGGQVAVVIFAEATAGEVSFRSQPRLHVRLSGGLDSVHVLDRRNLPSPVVTGTTYRDVHVAVEIFGRVNAECIARTLTGGAAADCASLELKGTSASPRPPGASSSTDSTTRPTPPDGRPPRN
jgi:hypothetical protein